VRAAGHTCRAYKNGRAELVQPAQARNEIQIRSRNAGWAPAFAQGKPG
jgi:hypothetical protein